MTAPAEHLTDDPSRVVRRARSRLANACQNHKKGRATDEEVADAKRALNEAVLARHIRELVDTAPPLTGEQRDRLTVLLRGGAR